MANGLQLFGLDIAGVVHAALRGNLRSGTLRRTELGTRDPADLAAGKSQTVTDYSFEGVVIHQFRDELAELTSLGTQVMTERRVLVMSRSLPDGVLPREGDQLLLDGATYSVERTAFDPAQAAYLCTVND